MNRLFCLLLITSTLMGLDVSVLDMQRQSMTIKVDISAPDVIPYEIGTRSIELQRWSDAAFFYVRDAQRITPVFTIPILLPPDGTLPEIEIVDSRSIRDESLPHRILAGELDADMPLPEFQTLQSMTLVKGENFRDHNTARILIMPTAETGQVLEQLTLNLRFPGIIPRGKTQDLDLISTYINAEMASNWAKEIPRNLRRTSSNLPSGQWFRFPINEVGIQQITAASFPEGVPTSDPRSWQVYAAQYEGRTLPFELSINTPLPENLRPISMKTQGLDDGVMSGEDGIIFFSKPLNGTFGTNSFTHHYGTKRYYWLCVPDDDTNAASSVSMLASSTLSETNTITSYEKRIYHEAELHNQLHSGTVWVGEKLTGSTDQFSINFTDDYLNFSSEIQLNASMVLDFDAGNYNHSFEVVLNGVPLNISQNPGLYKQISLSGTAGENMLRDGVNTLTINYSSSSSAAIVYLDSMRFTYHRQLAPSQDYLLGRIELPGSVTRLIFQDTATDFHLWDVSDPSDVKEWQIINNLFTLEGTGDCEIIGFNDDQLQLVVLSEAPNLGEPKLRHTNMQADHIIITPAAFEEQAERIRMLREEQVPLDERLNVEIVLIEDIYNEFSAGTLDPAAIKHFLHYVYFNWQSPRLRYVLLLGDTDFDYRNITGQSKMIIPTYQKNGNTDVSSYATDDRYTFIGSGEFDRLPDIAIGRFPAQTADQLAIMIDKMISYELTPEPGIWRNSITLVADDPLRPSRTRAELEHIRDTEGLASIVPPSIQINKIYLTEFPEIQDPNSPYIKKPAARDDFLQKLYNGTLLVNYLGHGSPTVWAQEEVFTASDLSLVKTGMRLPFWVAGTCDWAKYDDVNSSCVPEELMLMENNGAVGILSTTRKTYAVFNEILLSDFFDFVFPESNAGRSLPIGDAVMMAKNITTGSDPNNEKYILFADPAMRLASPVRKGVIDSISPSTFQAMGTVNYTGIADTSLAPDARAAVTVYDTPTPVTRSFYNSYTGSTGSISYVLSGKRIFRGLISVNDRDFSGSFTLPKDIKYSGNGGILRVQYWDDTGLDGSIFIDTLKFMGTDSTALDNEGPEIMFISDNMVLLNGDNFSANEALEIEISDPQGINLTGVAGHGITLAIDEDWENAYNVTELFEYDLDHSDLGRLSAYLSEIPPGEHLVSVKAWDSQNNPNESSVRLEFFAANDFRVYDLFNFPNPMQDDTDITYMLSHPADVQYAIYTLAGRKLISESQGYQIQGFNSFPWDGRDRFGNQLANGVYILVIEAESDEFTETAQTIQKIVITR